MELFGLSHSSFSFPAIAAANFPPLLCLSFGLVILRDAATVTHSGQKGQTREGGDTTQPTNNPSGDIREKDIIHSHRREERHRAHFSLAPRVPSIPQSHHSLELSPPPPLR